MPLLGRSGLDTFYAVPPSGVAIGLAQSPEPDISIVTPMDTYAIGNEVPLDPSLSYREIYRWVESRALTLSDVNVVLNPLLKYPDPTNVPLNTPPPNWVFYESSQTSNDRWKFYPHVHSQSSNLTKFPMSEIHPAGVGTTFTIMFPCGFSFLYSGEPIPSNPQQLYCMLGARTSSVQLNTPYVVEVYYFVHAAPPFGRPPSYPSSDSWKDQVFVRCTVYGLNSSNQTTETALQAELRHLRTNNSRGRMRHLAMDNRSGVVEDFASPIRRWIVSTLVNFTNPATIRSEIVFRVVGLPGFALLGVLMYPLSEIRTSVRSNLIHPTMYMFNASLDLSSQYGGRLSDREGYSYLPHAIDGPVRRYARVDRGGYASNERVPQPSHDMRPLYRDTGGNGLAIRVGEVMSKPPRLRFNSGDTPDRCSYLTDDADARPNVGLLSYPYSGGYVSVPLFITNNSVKLTYRAPSSRQYANWLEFFTDDIPVRPGIMYRLVLEATLQDYPPPPSYPYPNSSAPYMRLSFMCYQVAVYGYDKDNNLLETAFLAPFAPGSAPGSGSFRTYRAGITYLLGPIVTTSLMGYFTYQARDRNYSVPYNTIYNAKYGPNEDFGYPNPFYPFGFIRFNNNNVVKARIVVAIVQPYVRQSESVVFSSGLPPGNDTTPYLLVPPPDNELIVKKVGLHELWPVPYTTGQANFLDETTADFRNSAWGVSGGVVHSTSGYDYPGYYGGVAVISDPNRGRDGTAFIVLPWNQSSEMFVWPCFRMRFRLIRPLGKHPLSLTIRLLWTRDARDGGSIVGIVTRYLYLSQELLSFGQVTSLGNDYYEVDLPLSDPVKLTSPYPTKIHINLFMNAVDGTALHIGYFNVGFYDDPYGTSTRRVQVPAGIGPRVTINTPFIPPRVVGVEQISRYHWGVRIRPGLAYLRYVIPPDEADHSWLIRAGFNRGNDVVLVYTLPEYTATFVNGVPVSRRTERVMVRSGVFSVERPVHSGMEITVSTPDGLTVSGVGDGANRKFDVDMFGRQITIRDSAMSSYNGDAEVTYHYYSPDYVYTGCWYESSSGPVPAAFNLSAFSKSGLIVGPFSRQVVEQQYPDLSYGRSHVLGIANGVSIYLLPSMVIPYSRFVQGDRVGVRLPAHSGAVRSYVRHLFGAIGVSFRPNIYDNWSVGNPPVYYSASVAALRIAYIAQVPTLGWACVDLTDIRMRGGGVPVGSNVDVAAAYWDMSEWDGGYSSGAGRAIVRLPRTLLQPDRNRDALTHEHIVNLVNQYLPAGIDYEVEYVD